MSSKMQPSTLEQLLINLQRKVGQLDRRLSNLRTPSDSGTAAERDARYGAPATDAERVALANRQPSWFNTASGWIESYYAVTGLPGLTARGLVAGSASGWYPVAGSLLVGTRIKSNGFQLIAAGVVTAPDLLSTFLVRIGAFVATGTNAITVPIAGYYNITSSVYFSGGGAMLYSSAIVRYVGGAEIISARQAANNADMQPGVAADGVLVTAGQAVELVGQAAAANNFYGDGTSRRTFLTLKYAGPPLVSN